MKELTGSKLDEEAWISLLNNLEFTDLLLSACKVNQYLYKHGPTNPATQLKLSQDLISPSLFEQLKRVQNEYSIKVGNPLACRPVFMHLQCLNLVKRIYLHHNKLGQRRINPPDDLKSLRDFGELLLSVSDFLTPSNHDKKRESYLPAAMEFLRNSVFLYSPNFNKALARYHKLFFELPPKCSPGHFHNYTFEEVFEAATGAELKQLFSIGFGLMSQAAAIDLFSETQEPNAEFLLVPEAYFKESILERELWERALINLSLPERTMTEIIRRRHSEMHSAYEFSVISDFPLLECTPGRYVISHFPFLLDKFTNGVLRSILKYLERPVDRRREFKHWWGNIVQTYVSDLFKQEILPFSRSDDLILCLDDPYNTGFGTGKGTDVGIFDKQSGTFYLFEITASSLQYSVTELTDNWENFEKDLERIIYGKAKQIHKVIEQIKSGKLQIKGRNGERIDRSHINTYVPHVVSLNFFPNLPFVWNGFPNENNSEFKGAYAELSKRQVLCSDNIAALKVITIEEIESCCNMQKLGYPLLTLLNSWRASTIAQDWSFSTHLSHLSNLHSNSLQELDKQRSESGFSFVAKTLFGESQKL